MDNIYCRFSTHLPLLAQCVLKYGGRVLEVGCGWYSTQLLHAMSDQVTTLETDELWANRFWPIAGPKLQLCKDIVATAQSLSELPWQLVFIDSDGDVDRARIAEFFVNRCVVVAHDTEMDYWKPTLDAARYVKTYNFWVPHTSAFSNLVDVNQ